MDHEAYARDIQEAVQLFESGRFEEAAAAWRAMASNPGLPLPDRAIALMNLALTFAKLERPGQAEAAYNEGISIEDRLLRGFLREQKAAWLVERGNIDAALAIYEGLLRQFWLDSAQIKRCEHNIASLRS